MRRCGVDMSLAVAESKSPDDKFAVSRRKDNDDFAERVDILPTEFTREGRRVKDGSPASHRRAVLDRVNLERGIFAVVCETDD